MRQNMDLTWQENYFIYSARCHRVFVRNMRRVMLWVSLFCDEVSSKLQLNTQVIEEVNECKL